MTYEKIAYLEKMKNLANIIVTSETEESFLDMAFVIGFKEQEAISHLRTFNACVLNLVEKLPANELITDNFCFDKELAYFIFEELEDDNWNLDKRNLIRKNYKKIEEIIELFNEEKKTLKIIGVTPSGEYTLQEIADLLGVTRERVRQIETKALKKLRTPKIGVPLKRYLEIQPIQSITSY